ncbi:unnamed protein product [marine sediment metagenome]|uniref:Uncharacterized protein n=1 Tax=marine sediment metagenome TaxID=412755 RepID=X1LUA9_9ZZZZ
MFETRAIRTDTTTEIREKNSAAETIKTQVATMYACKIQAPKIKTDPE